MTEAERSYFEWMKRTFLLDPDEYIDDLPEVFERHVYEFRDNETGEVGYGISDHPFDRILPLREL